MQVHVPAKPRPTAVYDTLWRFAAERQRVYFARLRGQAPPWTRDPVLARYRFTNAYRAADRVSQELLREVIPVGPQSVPERFFRVMLFKLFNRSSTWALLKESSGVRWEGFSLEVACEALDAAMARQLRVYSAAYIMPSPRGAARKHKGHLALLIDMMENRLPETLAEAPSLKAAYEALLAWPSLGPFLAFQYAIDLNYAGVLGFSEADWVVAGPGALDGLAKCFSDPDGLSPEDLIRWTCDRQGEALAALDFRDLWGRPLQLIDAQNLFCEVAKVARVQHPDVAGTTGRARIKQGFTASPAPLPKPVFPERWGIQGAVDAWWGLRS